MKVVKEGKDGRGKSGRKWKSESKQDRRDEKGVPLIYFEPDLRPR